MKHVIATPKSLKIGSTLLNIDSRTIRCAIPSREQQQSALEQSAAISKSLYLATNRYFGVNVTVAKPGPIHSGDEIELVKCDL